MPLPSTPLYAPFTTPKTGMASTKFVKETADSAPAQVNDFALTRGAWVQTTLRYQGRHCSQDEYLELSVEVYKIGKGSEAELVLHVNCPKCGNALSVKSTEKKMDVSDLVSRGEGNPMDGKIDCEPWFCTWESDTDPSRREFGMHLCAAGFGIIKNRLVDAAKPPRARR